MGVSCCAVECAKRAMKGSGIAVRQHEDLRPSLHHRKVDAAVLTKKCDRFERNVKRKRPSASDDEAVAALLQLGSTEPDPTPIDNVVPCDVPEDVLTSPPALLGQHRIDEFPANLQLHMQKYLKKCLEFNALQDKVAALEKELEEHWASESVGREDIAPWEYSRIMDNSNQCWSGKNSDKQLVLLTDFTKKLQYGDEVMADRGFNVTEELAVLGRIRVEQVIGPMKRFRILKNTVPYFMQDYLDDIVLLIAALTNLFPHFK
ncbi:hypothetical protein MRX96_038513 [Rhipicephalus microplus]